MRDRTPFAFQEVILSPKQLYPIMQRLKCVSVEHIYPFYACSIPKLHTQIHKERVVSEELADFKDCVYEAERLIVVTI
ncbi:hypothetical protein TNCT_688741 [Trichonephila clavata]|uniref:Uncharacterized protein n=1 Tax=Trichonephila clavata TaxID=2740835 RepID=A0A8X6FCI0_TRICU|nr:hypothetical protein TNCT_688741 [Trichonephila clavata]